MNEPLTGEACSKETTWTPTSLMRCSAAERLISWRSTTMVSLNPEELWAVAEMGKSTLANCAVRVTRPRRAKLIVDFSRPHALRCTPTCGGAMQATIFSPLPLRPDSTYDGSGSQWADRIIADRLLLLKARFRREGLLRGTAIAWLPASRVTKSFSVMDRISPVGRRRFGGDTRKRQGEVRSSGQTSKGSNEDKL